MENQDIETVRRLLGEGADVKAKNDEGKCSLRVAMDLKFWEGVAAVLDFGIQEDDSADFWFNYTLLSTEKGNELSVIEEITKSSGKKLLLHPLVASFLTLKWHNIYYIAIAIWMFWIALVLSLTGVGFLISSNQHLDKGY